MISTQAVEQRIKYVMIREFNLDLMSDAGRFEETAVSMDEYIELDYLRKQLQPFGISVDVLTVHTRAKLRVRVIFFDNAFGLNKQSNVALNKLSDRLKKSGKFNVSRDDDSVSVQAVIAVKNQATKNWCEQAMDIKHAGRSFIDSVFGRDCLGYANHRKPLDYLNMEKSHYEYKADFDSVLADWLSEWFFKEFGNDHETIFFVSKTIYSQIDISFYERLLQPLGLHPRVHIDIRSISGIRTLTAAIQIELLADCHSDTELNRLKVIMDSVVSGHSEIEDREIHNPAATINWGANGYYQLKDVYVIQTELTARKAGRWDKSFDEVKTSITRFMDSFFNDDVFSEVQLALLAIIKL